MTKPALRYSIASMLLMTSPLGAEVKFKEPGELNIVCQFTEACFARTTYLNGQHCAPTQTELVIHKNTHESFLKVQKPNGSVEFGSGSVYERYEGVAYLLVSVSNGSGGSHITVMPDGSAVWTGHYTLQDNVADSSFGTCADVN
ncbi:hypothetical protein [uncultured Tateyamaria sp.]|uniref:hypothetical protein n=1 Tax=uncultured Tateyamaria sp. TaxID=455651 RepID=UPI0026049133|nr:hypothetical protein [uncultured Tateyamaria sp.]